jgi:hypothetical protein
MNPAEEVLLDPLFVNPCTWCGRKAILVPAARLESSGRVAPSGSELNASERDETWGEGNSQNARIG